MSVYVVFFFCAFKFKSILVYIVELVEILHVYIDNRCSELNFWENIGNNLIGEKLKKLNWQCKLMVDLPW